VIWITGFSGAGKTTVATGVIAELRKHHSNIVHVDGDAVRDICGNDLGYSVEDRLKNAFRVSRLCKFLSGQGLVVVCSTISLFSEVWQWNRLNIEHYREVFLDVNPEELCRRNQKGLYDADNSQTVVGVGQPYDIPPNAELVLRNVDSNHLAENVQRIIALFERRDDETR